MSTPPQDESPIAAPVQQSSGCGVLGIYFWGWMVFLVCIVLITAYAIISNRTVKDSLFVRCLVVSGSVIVMSGVAALVAWLFSRHSRAVTTVVFALAVVAFSTVQAAIIFTTRQDSKVATNLASIRKEYRELLIAQIYNEPMSEATREKLDSLAEEARKFGDPKMVNEQKGVSAFIQRMDADANAVRAALREMPPRQKLFQAKSREELSEMRGKVNAISKAAESAQASVRRHEEIFIEELEKAGVPSAVSREYLALFSSRYNKMREPLLALNESDKECADIVMKIIDLFIREWGNWKLNESAQMIAFDNKTATEEYEKIATQLAAAATKQSQLGRAYKDVIKSLTE
jgi:hypothetical protein